VCPLGSEFGNIALKYVPKTFAIIMIRPNYIKMITCSNFPSYADISDRNFRISVRVVCFDMNDIQAKINDGNVLAENTVT
jgi:hypothetical protein